MSNQQQQQLPQEQFTTYFYCPLQEQQVQVTQPQHSQEQLQKQLGGQTRHEEYYPANLYASSQCPQYAQMQQQQMTGGIHTDQYAQSAPSASSSLSNFNSNAKSAQLLHFGNQVYELKEESLESLLEEGLRREKQSGNFPLQRQSLLLGQIPSTTTTTTTVTVPTAAVHHAPIQPNSFIQVSADTQSIPPAPPVTISSSSSSSTSTSTTSTTSTITSSTTQAVVEKKGKGHPRKRKEKKRKKKGSTSSSSSSQSTDGESTSDESTHLHQQQQQQQQQQKELIYRGALHRRNSKPLPGDKFISTWILK